MSFVGVFNIPTAQATTYTFTEDFSTTTYKDSANTTADWNTSEGLLSMPVQYDLDYLSSYLKGFGYSDAITAIATDAYKSKYFIGGSNGKLNFSTAIRDENAYHDLSNSLINFNDIDINAIDFFPGSGTVSGGDYTESGWLVGGGYDYGSGGNSGPRFNKLSNCSSSGCEVVDLSSELSALGFWCVHDISCKDGTTGRDNTCIITSTSGNVALYDGNSFINLTDNVDLNSTIDVSWNGSYWLLGGTSYSGGLDYIGRIYKYDGSSFEKIKETHYSSQSHFTFGWNGEYWLIGRGTSPLKLYKYIGNSFENLSSKLDKFSWGQTSTLDIAWSGHAWFIGGDGIFIRYTDDSMINLSNLPDESGSTSLRVRKSAVIVQQGQDSMIIGATDGHLILLTDYGYSLLISIGQSKKINTTTNTIVEATLTVTDNQPSNTSIIYYLSANGGINWEQVAPGSKHIFTNLGNDLRWKIELKRRLTYDYLNTSAVVRSLSINYETSLSSITVISPNGGQQWQKGKEYTVKFEYNDIDSAMIELKRGSSAVMLAGYPDGIPVTGSPMSYKVLLPDSVHITPASDYKLWLLGLKDGTKVTEDYSGGYISIIEAITPSEDSITVSSPDGGEKWEIGKTYNITWSSKGVDRVKIMLSKKDPTSGFSDYYWISAPISNTGKYSWTIPVDVETGNEYAVRVVDADNTLVNDFSDNCFSIIETAPPETCLPDGTLIKLPTDPKIYVIVNCKKKWIRTAEEFREEGYKWEEVEEVSSPVIEAYADYLEAKANLLRAIGQQRVYRIVDEKRLWIPTIATFNAQGLKWEDIQDVNETTVNQYPRLKLARITGDPKVYYLTESGLKRWIPTVTVFNSYDNKWEDVIEISATELNAYPDNDLIRLEGGTKVYKLENGKKRWIKTVEAFNRLQFNWHEIAPANTTEINSYADGAIIE